MKYINGKPVIRCSSLNQVIECPASIAMQEAAGERDDERDSWEGNWCHWATAKRFIEDFGAMGPEGGLPPPNVPKDYAPAGFTDWIVDFCVRATMEAIPGDWAMEVEAEGLLEFPTWWLSGHVDVAGIAPDGSAVKFRDHKAGINSVDIAECNWQVLGYAALYKGHYRDTLKSVEGGINQPRNDDEIYPRVSTVTIEGAQLDNLLSFLDEKVKAALANSTFLNSDGQKQCRWCSAALQCPATIADRDHMKMTLTAEALAAVKKTPDDAVLAKWVIARRHLSSKLEAAAKLCKERLEATGRPIQTDEGTVQLVEALGNREITDVGAVWGDLAETVEPEEAYGCMSLRITDTEKALAAALSRKLGKKVPHESKDPMKLSGKKEFFDRYGKFITRKPSKELTIVS